MPFVPSSILVTFVVRMLLVAMPGAASSMPGCKTFAGTKEAFLRLFWDVAQHHRFTPLDPLGASCVRLIRTIG